MALVNSSTSTDSRISRRFPKKDLTGQRFGRLAVTGLAEYRGTQPCWHCQCDCGNLRIVLNGSLLRGATKSCGCLHAEFCHTYTRRHGQCYTAIYKRWKAMMQRCSIDPSKRNYKYYAGRGIYVCERWCIFENFYADMGGIPPKGTLERLDNNQGYFKENCIWATQKQQNNNRSDNRLLSYGGKTQTLVMWAEEKSLNPATLRARLRRRWTIEDALTIPINTQRPYKGIRRKRQEIYPK